MGYGDLMSFIEKVKQFFKKTDQSIITAPPKGRTAINSDVVHSQGQLADENWHKQKEAEGARLEKNKAEERLKKQRILEQQKAEQERLRKQQAEAARLEEIKAQDRINQQRIFEQQLAEQARHKENKEKERRAVEVERLRQIHALNQGQTYIEYLREAERFRKDYSKNIKCDICGEWEVELFNHRGQTYCEKHIPIARHTENEHKVTAGRHGSSRSYIKR